MFTCYIRILVTNTVVQEIFTLKIICVKKFRVDKFLRSIQSSKFFLVKCFICMLNFPNLRYYQRLIFIVTTVHRQCLLKEIHQH